MAERIGLIGLGIMGKPMAHHLLRGGYQVMVYNRSRPAMDELAGAGARVASTGREVAEQSDVVITMLPDSPDVEAVVLGGDGILAGAHEGLLVIDMSTISPLTVKRMVSEAANYRVHVLDAPVSGGDAGARSATL